MRARCRPLLLLAAVACAAGCTAGVQPPKTQLEVREFQTRTFDTPDHKLVMKAMLNVLQNDGYVVKKAVVDLGLTTAEKKIDVAPARSRSEERREGNAVRHAGRTE